MGILRLVNLTLASGLICTSSAGLAATPNTDQPMLSHAEKAVTQPARDLNLKKEKIPARLLEIQKAPYDLAGLDGCQALTTEINSLYPMLGPDVDSKVKLSRTEKRERSVGRVAGGIIGGLIPFRGIVREVSGANAADQRYQKAMSAGFARRSFLKGIAFSKGCEKSSNSMG